MIARPEPTGERLQGIAFVGMQSLSDMRHGVDQAIERVLLRRWLSQKRRQDLRLHRLTEFPVTRNSRNYTNGIR